MFSRFTINLASGRKRYETYNGKQYLVLPAVALTEGVHTGSKGALYYPPEEIARNPMSFNHKPVVIYHPEMPDGQGITACDPAVLEAQGVGLIFNSECDGRLKMETWLEEDKLRRIAPGVADAIDNNRMVEVSTGIYHDTEETTGTWNGEQYSGVVRNMQGDHLAILPDQKAACSIADGAGLLRNAAAATTDTSLSFDDVREQIRSLVRTPQNLSSGPLAGCGGDSFCWVCDVFPKYAIVECNDKMFKVGYKVKGGKVVLDGEPEQVRKVTSYVTANRGRVLVPTVNDSADDTQGPVRLPPPSEEQLSDVMKHQQMQTALGEHYSGVAQEGDWGGWVTDLYANYVVYYKDGKRFRLPYTYDDDMIRFDGEPEEVMRSSEYVTRRTTPIDGTQSPYNVNRDSTMPPTPAKGPAKPGTPTRNVIHQGAHQIMHDATHVASDAHHDAPQPDGTHKTDGQVRTRHERVSAMINAGHAKEDDRKRLTDLPDDHFESVESFVMRGATTPIQPYTYEGIGDRSNAHTANRQGRAVSVNEYIQQAPPEFREVLTNAVESLQEEKKRLVDQITRHPSNRFNPAWLLTQNMQQLRGMAALTGSTTQEPRRPNYGGQGDTPMFLEPQEPTVNQAASDEDDVLPIPAMNFERSAS